MHLYFSKGLQNLGCIRSVYGKNNQLYNIGIVLIGNFFAKQKITGMVLFWLYEKGASI